MYSEPKTVSALFGLICELISQINYLLVSMFTPEKYASGAFVLPFNYKDISNFKTQTI